MTEWRQIKAAEKWDMDDLPEALQPQPTALTADLSRVALRDERRHISHQISTNLGRLGLAPKPHDSDS